MARAVVRRASTTRACRLDGAIDLVSACRELARLGVSEALVRDGERMALFTPADLPAALLRAEPPARLPLREVVGFDAAAADGAGSLPEALALMRRQGVQQLLVRDGGEVRGVLAPRPAELLAGRADPTGAAIDAAASRARAARRRGARRRGGGAHARGRRPHRAHRRGW